MYGVLTAVSDVAFESPQVPEDGPLMRSTGFREADMLLLLVGGGSDPTGEQHTVA